MGIDHTRAEVDASGEHRAVEHSEGETTDEPSSCHLPTSGMPQPHANPL